jgi:hypothetical protein
MGTWPLPCDPVDSLRFMILLTQRTWVPYTVGVLLLCGFMCQPHEPVFSSNYVHLRRVRGKDVYMIMPRVQLVICAMLVHTTSIPVWIQSRRARRCICQEMRCTCRCVGVWFVKCCCCSSAVQLQQGNQKVSLQEEAKTAKHVKRLWNKALVETGANLGNTAHATLHPCARCWLIFPSVATVQKFAGPVSKVYKGAKPLPSSCAVSDVCTPKLCH